MAIRLFKLYLYRYLYELRISKLKKLLGKYCRKN